MLLTMKSFLVCLVALAVVDPCRSQEPVFTPEGTSNPDFNHMLLSPDGQHMYLAGKNTIYHLNATTLTLINKVSTGPWNETFDDVTYIMMYNNTETAQYITTCNDSFCSIRDLDNVATISHHLTPPIRTPGSAAFIVTENQGRGPEYLYVASPSRVTSIEQCSGKYHPGIARKPFHGDIDDIIKFQCDISDLPVKIEKYVAAFPVENYVLFFSVQKIDSVTLSRVAQMCVTSSHTDKTYVDMEIRCGECNVIQTVSQIKVMQEIIIVAAFTNKNRDRSAVCAYRFSDMKKRFVDNIKACYSGIRPIYEDDYIKTKPNRCTRNSLPDVMDMSDEYFLCNEDGLSSFFSVIGNNSLHDDPVVSYTGKVITGVTLKTIASKVVAFLGTRHGYVLKAVVYPKGNDVIRKIPSNYDILRQTANKDMYTSADGEHIYVLTATKVVKLPVQHCSSLQSCDRCLGSGDPHCGWCWGENRYRCSINGECATEWIAAADNNTCPTIVSISPHTLSVQNSMQLTLRVSHRPINNTLYCMFSNNEEGTRFRDSAVATLHADGTIRCMSPIISVEDAIKGYLTVKVSIRVNGFDSPMMGADMIFYNCRTFTSCITCEETRWNCGWCVYTNACYIDEHICDNDINVLPRGKCPEVTNYTLVGEDNSTLDEDGGVHLVTDENYEVIISGRYLVPPKNEMVYTCVIEMSEPVTFQATYESTTEVQCHLSKNRFVLLGEEKNTNIQLQWAGTDVAGTRINVNMYNCSTLVQPSYNCDKCKSFAELQPFYHCHWCGGRCTYTGTECNSSVGQCPSPEITNVSPLSCHVNGTILVEIQGYNLGSRFNQTIDAVTIADTSCTSVRTEAYKASESITCWLSPRGAPRNGSVVVVIGQRQFSEYAQPFSIKVATIDSVSPSIGPKSGGTTVTVTGTQLDTGSNRTLYMGNVPCNIIRTFPNNTIICRTGRSSVVASNQQVRMDFDGASVSQDNVTFSYVEDPTIRSITPRKSFNGGGRRLTIEGTNFHAIQEPRMFVWLSDEEHSKPILCENSEVGDRLYCFSPRFRDRPLKSSNRRLRTRVRRDLPPHSLRLGFKMDGVKTVEKPNRDLANILYFANPDVFNFTNTEKYNKILVIKGRRLSYAAQRSDVLVLVGVEKCNVTTLENSSIICDPPSRAPRSADGQEKELVFPVSVEIGYLSYDVGQLEYEQHNPPSDSSESLVIAGAVGGAVVLLLAVLVIAGVIMIVMNKRRTSRYDRELEIKMDRLEATFRNQCREEFAALQTAVSDLTSDLQGGNVLFLDYEEYACRTLFAANPNHPIISPPAIKSDTTDQAMETFRGLLKNQQFLMTFIKILESQKSFTIQDKSNVASILMVVNHDNMEYITGIMTSLLNDLVDKNIAAQTPKLMLRRSECVVEKLLTHWLSVCLYRYLKDHSGSVLYILYKAIKTQVEKGPVDYITSCAKYTLSEDKLFTSGDKEIKPQILTLDVNHYNNVEDKEMQIQVEVLDCDTITQAKAKILEVLYKNIAYSNRPLVHKTVLAVLEGDGTQRVLHDEDPSSIKDKDGIWRKINTLQYYSIPDGTKVKLSLNTEMKLGISAASPEGYIGSCKRKTMLVRTISGSNYWHLTKQHEEEDGREGVKLSSDLFLPRLLNTKGTLQQYIDDLFTEMLSSTGDPPLIIKYLFDFLDTAATKCGITDVDVLHTWKCNSLLLRFWVNIIKNPEFVFDIHKPLIVDSCLSVVAQTLMDSCSTADLKLGPHSPFNKLLFAKDIPRYKVMVRQYFEQLKSKPSVSDQELNSYLTENVSQKFCGKFHQSSALLEMYKYAARYRSVILSHMDDLEASSPGTFNALSAKLEYVFMTMDQQQQATGGNQASAPGQE